MSFDQLLEQAKKRRYSFEVENVVKDVSMLPPEKKEGCCAHLTIGVLSMPMPPGTHTNKHTGDQYILNINRRFVEYNGKAKAVPIRYDLGLYDEIICKHINDFDCDGHHHLPQVVEQLDAILFTGGFLPLRKVDIDGCDDAKIYYNTAKEIFKIALEKDVPIMGVCQGMQLIQLLAADLSCPAKGPEYRNDVLSDVKHFNENRKTVFEVPNPNEQSKLFSKIDPDVIKAMEEETLTFHAHNWSVTKKDFLSKPYLNEFYTLVSTDDGKVHDNEDAAEWPEFVTAIEAKNHPILGVQYHPEYQNMEFYPDPALLGFNKSKTFAGKERHQCTGLSDEEDDDCFSHEHDAFRVEHEVPELHEESKSFETDFRHGHHQD